MAGSKVPAEQFDTADSMWAMGRGAAFASTARLAQGSGFRAEIFVPTNETTIQDVATSISAKPAADESQSIWEIIGFTRKNLTREEAHDCRENGPV